MTLLQKTLGLFFVIFGLTKVVSIFGFGYGFAGTVGFVASLGYPFAAALVLAAIAAEVLLGLVLLLPQLSKNGAVYQKYAAYGLLLFTIAATLMFHFPFIGGETLTPELTSALKNIVVAVALWTVGKNSN